MIFSIPVVAPPNHIFSIYVLLLFAINLLLARAGETEDLELRFVVKNCYNAFASTSKFDISGNSKPKSIEPYRKHFFTAVIDDSQEEHNIVYNSIMADEVYKELKELGDRGGGNKESLAQRVEDTKKFFGKSMQAEAEDENYTYVFEINGETYEGKTVGPILFELDEGQILVEVKQFDAKKRLLNQHRAEIVIAPVRRTMGELLASDRMKFFSAVQKMYAVPTEEGRKEFGENYVGMQDVWAAHNLFAVDSEHYLLDGGVDEASSTKLLSAAAEHSRITHSYRKPIQKGDLTSYMEIDADLNEYTEKKGRNPNAIVSSEFNGGKDKLGALQKLAASHSMLVNSQHAQMMTNFATFATWFEKGVQSVDPSVALPYFDEGGELGGTNFQSSVWKEKYSASRGSMNLIAGATGECSEGDGECPTDDETIIQVETEGKFTYVPIITHQEGRFENGVDVSVSKGFAVPLITKEKERDAEE